MYKNFKLNYRLNSSLLFLSAFLTVPTLASEKYPEKESHQTPRKPAQIHHLRQQDDDQEDYPKKLGFFILPYQAPAYLEHQAKAEELKAPQLLKEAEKLIEDGDTNAFAYLVPLICNDSYLNYLRDRAAIDYIEFGLNLLQINSEIPEKMVSALVKSVFKCAKILSQKHSACARDRAAAKTLLGLLNSPVFGKTITYSNLKQYFKKPAKAEELLQSALEFSELEQKWRAFALNELGALYLNDHLGTGEQAFQNACKFYSILGADESFSSNLRLDAKLYQLQALQGLQKPLETLDMRRDILSSIKNHPEISPALLKEVIIDEAYIDLEEMQYTSKNNKSREIMSAVASKLENLLDETDLRPEGMIVRDLAYATSMVGLILHHNHPREPLEENIALLGKYVNQEQAIPMNFWSAAVIAMVDAILVTKNPYGMILGNKKIDELLDAVVSRTDETQQQLCAKAYKALLAAKELIKIKPKDKGRIFQKLIKYTDNPRLPAYIRLKCYITLAQEIPEFYPKYNMNVKQLVDRLKELLKVETGLLARQKVEFILLQYYMIYKKCEIQYEEVIQYISDLQGPDVPSYLQVERVFEEQVGPELTEKSEPILETSLLELENKIDEIETPTEEISLPDISEKQRPDQGLSIPFQPKKPDNVVRYDPIKDRKEKGVKEERDIEKAKLLLERLKSRRGKVSQREVTNMLRRLDYTFEPSQDEGLTIHLGHKGRGNKKGATGRLKGGARRDTANVLKDALNKDNRKN